MSKKMQLQAIADELENNLKRMGLAVRIIIVQRDEALAEVERLRESVALNKDVRDAALLDRNEKQAEVERLRAQVARMDSNEAVEAAAKALAMLEPGEDWPTNEALGGNATGTRDDEYRDAMRDQARDALRAALAIEKGTEE